MTEVDPSRGGRALLPMLGHQGKRGIRRLRRAAREFVTEVVPPSGLEPVASRMADILAATSAPLRPAYLYGVLRAAHTARSLGIEGIWVAEMGVAAGGGLLSLAAVANEVGGLYGVAIEAVGFDTGQGLPAPTDPRDAPFAFEPGDYVMDPSALRAKLPSNARLVLGDVADTVAGFVAESRAPLGFVANDLDYYTLTIDSLRPIVAANPEKVLPRVLMYFDDLLGYPYSMVNGEWAAITDLNAEFPVRPIGQIYGLRWHLGSAFVRQPWPEMMFMLEYRDHPLFARSERSTTRPLTI